MKDGAQNNFYWIYLAGFYLIILQMLNVIPFWSDPGDWGKAILFRIIFSVLLVIFIWQALSRQLNLTPIKEKIKYARLPLLALGALFLVFLLATLFSQNINYSLWGDPFRSGGFINLALYLLFGIFAFLVIQEKDWKKILDFTIIISWLVCLVAFFQQFSVLSNIFVPIGSRPIGTMGNPIFLSIYLLLITFFPLAFAIFEKNKTKKIFYFSSSFLFVFVAIFLAQTRGAYLGLIAGFFFLFFWYPSGQKKIKQFKIYGAILLVLLILGSFSLKIYLDKNLYIYQKLPSLFSVPLDRVLSLFEGSRIAEARASTWKVSWQAFLERPLFGYGPENFVSAFDKHYDPSLPRIGNIIPGEELWQWFDRAHNIVFDLLVTGGAIALIAYFTFFGILFWELQKLKVGKTSKNIIPHYLQATFVGYLVSLLSAFDSVSTQIIAFLIIGYSLHLISTTQEEQSSKITFIAPKFFRARNSIMIILLIGLTYFLISFNINPLYLNKDLNIALRLADLRTKQACERAFSIASRIAPKSENSIISNYLGQKNTFVVYGCNNKITEVIPEDLIRRNIEILKKNVQRNSQYTNDWILLGEYTTILIKEKNRGTENIFIETEEAKQLKTEAENFFTIANTLSPKRQIILKDWAELAIATGDYQTAENKLTTCLALNPSYGRCYWYMALNKGYQKDYKEFEKFSALAKEYGVILESQEFLQEIINMYIRNDDYEGLAKTYPRLIPLTTDPLEKAQLHASLAATYQQLGNNEAAIKEILKIKDLIPSLPQQHQEAARNDVENFLKTLTQ